MWYHPDIMVPNSLIDAIDSKVFVVFCEEQGIATRLDHRSGINAVSYWRTRPEYLPRILTEFIREMDLADVAALARGLGITHMVEIGADHKPLAFDEIK